MAKKKPKAKPVAKAPSKPKAKSKAKPKNASQKTVGKTEKKKAQALIGVPVYADTKNAVEGNRLLGTIKEISNYDGGYIVIDEKDAVPSMVKMILTDPNGTRLGSAFVDRDVFKHLGTDTLVAYTTDKKVKDPNQQELPLEADEDEGDDFDLDDDEDSDDFDDEDFDDEESEDENDRVDPKDGDDN